MKKVPLTAFLFVASIFLQGCHRIPGAAQGNLRPGDAAYARRQFDSKGQYMVCTERSSMPSVEDLAQPELRIAGLRISE